MQAKKQPEYSGAIDRLVAGSKDPRAAATVIAAEQVVIGYYFDMLAAMSAVKITGRKPKALPSQEPMRKAVIAINQACANQKVPYLFTGKPGNVKDMFAFAAGITAPAMA